jgi:hypothetical protein
MTVDVTFFDPVSCKLGSTFSGPASQLANNTPAGWSAVDGLHDAAARRVRLVTGDFGDQYPVVEDLAEPPDAPDLETLAALARVRRNGLLAASDWVVARAYERGEAVPPEWAAYRAALRDLTYGPNFPVDIAWPDAPTP